MEFRILGTLEISADGATVPLRAPQLRNLLAMLLVRPRELVSIDELVERLWEDEQYPANPSGTIHTYVRRLRAIVGSQILRTRDRGYLLDAEPTDLASFRSLTAEAALTLDASARVELLRRALALWRGDPMGGVLSAWVRRDVVTALREERLLAQEGLIDTRLSLGEHLAMLPELSALTAQHPLRERLHGQLITALARTGRQAEGLAAYDGFALRLADDYGIDPSPQLRSLRQAVLTGELAASAPVLGLPVPVAGVDVGWRPQYQLPLDLQNLVGRNDQLGEIEKLVRDADAMPVVILSGPPGIGKSALAVRAAHRLATDFPDGQWYVRLRGASDQPRDVEDVLQELIRLSGVDQRSIPDDRDARSALLRSRLAGRRVLLVLDDARDARQVRSLLPGAAGNAVLITSRSGLDSLVALDGAVGIRLDVLAPDDSAELVSRLLGSSQDPTVVAALMRLCGGLPLALRIAGANAAGSHGSLGDYVERMRSTGPLSMLAIAGDDEAAVSTAFSTSYRLLDPAVQRGFRLLSAFPGAEFGLGAAIALIGEDGPLVLDRLERASLLLRPDSDRYQLHDLVREYGASLAEDDPELVPARNALCAWYLAMSNAAARALFPDSALPAAPVDVPAFDLDADAATSWFEKELANIEAVARKASQDGRWEVVWNLADIIRPYAYQYSKISQWQSQVMLGLDPARTAREVLVEGKMAHAAAVVAGICGDIGSAIDHGLTAVELHRPGGPRSTEAAMWCSLGFAYNEQEQLSLSVEALDRGIDILREDGETSKLPKALLNQCLNHVLLGNLSLAISCIDELLALDPGTSPTSVAGIGRVTRASAYRLLGKLDLADQDLTTPVIRQNGVDRVTRLLAVALVRADQGRHDEAHCCVDEALRLSLTFGSIYHTQFSQLHRAHLHLRHGDYAAAKAQYKALITSASASALRTVAAEAHYGLAECIYRLGDPAGAVPEAQTALTALRQTEQRLGECNTHLLLARTYTALNQPAPAAAHATTAQQILTETGYVPPTLP